MVRAKPLPCICMAAVLAACGSASTPDCPDGAEPFGEYQLFMGRSGADGEVVSDAAWEEFLAESVTPRFPDGLTVVDARGQWRGDSGEILRERSKVLVIVVPPGPEALHLTGEIAREYRQRFDQESVLRTSAHTCVDFS